MSKVRPRTAAPQAPAILAAYRLGDNGRIVAPNSGPEIGPGPYAPLGGVYASILNCSPWVEPNTSGSTAWVMLNQHGNGSLHIQSGWVETAYGNRTTLVELEDSVTDFRANVQALTGPNQPYLFERCDNPSTLHDLACAGSMPYPTAGSQTYYTIEFHGLNGSQQQHLTIEFDVSGTRGILDVVRAIADKPILRTGCTVNVRPELLPPNKAHVSCSINYNLYGMFYLFAQQSVGPRVQIATAPARFIPNQALLAGEIQGSFDQMPGTQADPETFDDAHVYSGGAWVGFGGQTMFNGKAISDPGPFGIKVAANSPTGPEGQHIEIWDRRIS